MSESMTIPDGLSCGDCRMYPKCSAIIGVKRDNKECDFFPVKFVPSAIMFAAYKRDYETLKAELAASQAREREQTDWAKKLEAAVDDAGRMMEEAQAERNVAQGKLDSLREMAQELKRQYASYRYADSVGCAVEWQGEHGEDYRNLESALMKKLIGEQKI